MTALIHCDAPSCDAITITPQPHDWSVRRGKLGEMAQHMCPEHSRGETRVTPVDILGVGDAARFLGVTRASVWAWRKRGAFPAPDMKEALGRPGWTEKTLLIFSRTWLRRITTASDGGRSGSIRLRANRRFRDQPSPHAAQDKAKRDAGGGS